MTLEGVTGGRLETVADADGNWSVTYPTDLIAGGEYDIPVSITATDALGNRTVITDTLVVDTVPHLLAIDDVTADNVANAAEIAGGLVLGGTSIPGAVIDLALQLQGGATITVQAQVDASGNWSVTLDPAALPAGEYAAVLTATTTDPAGNASRTIHDFRVDTQGRVMISDPVAADNVVNVAEAGAGVVLTGTSEAGTASVEVEVMGVTRTAIVAADGTWQATFEAGALPGGEYDAAVTVTAVDAEGNPSGATLQIRIDTLTSVGLDAGQAGGDNLINATKAAAGVTLTGSAEAGAQVQATMQGVTRDVTADPAGRWEAAFTAGEVAPGAYAAEVTVVATDAAGNVARTTGTVDVDTTAAVTITCLVNGVDGTLYGAAEANGTVVSGTTLPGSAVAATLGGVTRAAIVAADGSSQAVFAPDDLPPGTYDAPVSAQATRASGNTATGADPSRYRSRRCHCRNSGRNRRCGQRSRDRERRDRAGHHQTGGATSVRVRFEAVDRLASVAADGTWQVAFAPERSRRANIPRP